MNKKYSKPLCEMLILYGDDILSASDNISVEDYNESNPLDKVGEDIF